MRRFDDQFPFVLSEVRYSHTTTDHYVKQSSYMTDYLAAHGMEDFSAVTQENIYAYIRTLAGFTYKTVEQHLCSLRAFFRFLYQEGIITVDFAAEMPLVKARKQTAIPSVWTHETDIKGPRFENFNWAEKKLCFVHC